MLRRRPPSQFPEAVGRKLPNGPFLMLALLARVSGLGFLGHLLIETLTITKILNSHVLSCGEVGEPYHVSRAPAHTVSQNSEA